MLRVALLLPVVMVLSLVVRHRFIATTACAATIRCCRRFCSRSSPSSSPAALAHSQAGRRRAERVPRACLVIAIAAVGLKTSLVDMKQVGARGIVLLGVETVFLAAAVLAAQMLS